MREALPVSVHVLTYNSGKTLRRALESVKECDEILVIDGGSTDGTIAIAEGYGAKILSQHRSGHTDDFSSARNVGMKNARCPWILALDSDECLHPAALEEIKEIVRTRTQPAAYYVPRQYALDDGTIVDHASTYPNERLYFFHHDAVEQWVKPVHERPHIKPGIPVYRLRHGSIAPLGTIDEFWEKNNRYIQIEREKSKGRGWGYWLRNRLWRALLGQIVSTGLLLRIWLIPRRGTKLPLTHEWVRWVYRWKLVWETRPT